MSSRCINSFVIIDLETTGLPNFEFNRTKITEICLLATSREQILLAKSEGVSLPRVLHKLSICVNPRKMIQPISSELTGLYNELLEKEKPFDENLCDMLIGFLGRLTPPICMVAHNGMKFDFPVLLTELYKCGKILSDDILCADSYIGFKELLTQESIHNNYRSDVKKLMLIDGTQESYQVESDPNAIEKLLLVDGTLDSIDKAFFQEKFSSDLVISDISSNSPTEKGLDTRLDEDKNGFEVTAGSNEEGMRQMQMLNETTPERSKNLISSAPQLVKRSERNPSHSTKPVRKRLFQTEYEKDSPALKSFKLVDICHFLLRKSVKDSHRAECDTLNLLECIVASGNNFINWADNNSIMLNLVKRM